MIIINIDFLYKVAPILPVIKIKSSIKIYGISVLIYIFNKYIQLPMYIVDRNYFIINYFYRPIYIINNIRVKFVIDMNIINFKN